MSALPKPDSSCKWEIVRRLRYGSLVKLFRHRWGHILPDDDAGRTDLWELLTNISLARGATGERLTNAIEVWAPWMEQWEADRYVEHVQGLSLKERTPTARELGERLRVTNAVRTQLKLWQFKPIDATDEDIAAQRRARRNERRRTKRGRTRAEYLASCLSATKPWAAEGIKRRTWERRRKRMSQLAVPISSSSDESKLATASAVETKKGLHGSAEVVRLSERTKAIGAERTASGSSRLSPHLRQLEREQNAVVFANLAREFLATDPRMSWAMLACFVSTCLPLEQKGAV